MTIVLAMASLLMAAGAELPAVYHGHWTTDPTACGGEDTRGVEIAASAITFYEARGIVRSASEGAKGASAKVDFMGEGKSWSEAIRLHPLDRDRLELTALGRTLVYQRCPARPAG